MAFGGYQVLQVMPAAPDWRALFADESVEGLILEAPLMGWALVERSDGLRSVVGLEASGEVESCEAVENFIGYAAPGEPASRWHHDALVFFRERQRELAPVQEPT